MNTDPEHEKNPSATNFADQYLRMAHEDLKKLKKAGEHAIEQLSDSDLHVRINEKQNSIAVIMKHMSGNMRSRFTDFLTSDGEKPDRNREEEFREEEVSRKTILSRWQDGWARTFEALKSVTNADLLKTVYIRGEPHSVLEAFQRQSLHYAQHIGQILLIAKHIRGDDWRYLTIPPGQSDAFNTRMREKFEKTRPENQNHFLRLK